MSSGLAPATARPPDLRSANGGRQTGQRLPRSPRRMGSAGGGAGIDTAGAGPWDWSWSGVRHPGWTWGGRAGRPRFTVRPCTSSRVPEGGWSSPERPVYPLADRAVRGRPARIRRPLNGPGPGASDAPRSALPSAGRSTQGGEGGAASAPTGEGAGGEDDHVPLFGGARVRPASRACRGWPSCCGKDTRTRISIQAKAAAGPRTLAVATGAGDEQGH